MLSLVTDIHLCGSFGRLIAGRRWDEEVTFEKEVTESREHVIGMEVEKQQDDENISLWTMVHKA
jgi:hypothetical protein